MSDPLIENFEIGLIRAIPRGPRKKILSGRHYVGP